MKKFGVFVIGVLIISSFGFTEIRGKFEVGFHYSYWTIDMIAPLLEDMTPELDYYDPEKGDINFNSNGNNFGFDVRFFPSGKNGSFSLGISYERNNFKANIRDSYPEVRSGVEWINSLKGDIDLRPHSFNLSLCWDLWPKAKVHPYLGFGFGFGSLSGTAQYYVETTDQGVPDPVVLYETEKWTLKELIAEYEQEEGKSFPLSFFPIIHINFGLRGEIIDNLYLLAEFALYDGLIFRGGIAYRF
jgi:hypothetical protein